jgi:CheY-like chemotaxis protein
MPKVDGKMVLQEVKNDPELRLIPVIMLTTSSRERDILDSYNLGVNAYITKPVDIAQFQKIINELEYFWLVMAKLPTTLSKKFNSDNDEDYDFTNYDI